MIFKRTIAVLAALTMTVTGGAAVSAHCGGHGVYETRRVCGYENCQITETHTHEGDGCSYYGHTQGDGHDHQFENHSHGRGHGGHHC